MDFASAFRLIGLALIALPFACGISPPLSFSISAPPSQATITIAGQAFVVDPANIVLDSSTVQPGSAGISVDGEVVSADIANDLFVAGIEVLTGTTSSTLASSTAMNRTASPKSTNVTFSGSFAPTSAPAAGTGLTGLAGEIAHLAGQMTSKYANHTSGDVVSTSISASTSGVAASSSRSAPLQPAMASSASFYLSSSSLSNTASATATPNVQANSSQPQSRNTAFDSMPASTSKANLIPTGFSTYTNSSSGMYPVAGVSRTSQSAASSPQSLGSTGNPSQSASLAPGAMPNTITTGPTLVFPTLSLNPTGSVASSQGMLLFGAIFGITEKAKTLSAIIKDDGPKISFVSEVKGVENNVINLLEDIHPPGPPPSYEDSCLDGGSIFDIFKDLGCLKGGFDEVIADLEDDTPDIPKIQIIFDNIGKLAENLEEEEEDDDEKTTATDGSSASRTSTPSMTSSVSSRVSSSTATASMTLQPIDKNPFADPDPSDNSGTPNIADQAFMAFLGDVLSSAVGIGPGPSGFAVVIGSANATANPSSSPLMSSTTSVASTLSAALNITSAPATSGSSNVGITTSQVVGGESASSQAVVSSTATNPSSSSNVAAGFASSIGEEIAFIASELAVSHSAQSAGVGTTTQVPTSAAAAVASAEALIAELASIAKQIASSSAAAVEAASIASLSAATSSPPASPAPSTQPAKTEWGIFLGLQTYTQGGVDPWTDYYYKIWMTDLTQTPAGPDYCGKENWIANVQVNDLGSDTYPPYPSKDFDFAIPAGVLQPAKLGCIWQPSPGGSSPGSLSCDPGGQTVLCTNSTLKAVICQGDNQDRVEPLSECMFSW